MKSRMDGIDYDECQILHSDDVSKCWVTMVMSKDDCH